MPTYALINQVVLDFHLSVRHVVDNLNFTSTVLVHTNVSANHMKKILLSH